ncbi:hypothetical protein D3C86_1872530 [compost metagenome]
MAETPNVPNFRLCLNKSFLSFLETLFEAETQLISNSIAILAIAARPKNSRWSKFDLFTLYLFKL